MPLYEVAITDKPTKDSTEAIILPPTSFLAANEAAAAAAAGAKVGPLALTPTSQVIVRPFK